MVTRSGGNELHGSLDVRWHSSQLAQSGDHFDPDLEPFRSMPWSATLGGPFVKGALWFFASLARIDEVATPALGLGLELGCTPEREVDRRDPSGAAPRPRSVV